MQIETRQEPRADKSATLSLLIVDDEAATRNLCNDVALEAGLNVYASATTEQALDILGQYPIDIVATDLRIPQMGGLELIKRIRAGNPQVSIIALARYGTIEMAIEATRLGAADYITTPFHVAELRTKLDRLVHSIEIDQENRLLREQLRSKPGFGGLIGVSAKMQRVYKLIEKVAQHTYPVLILGESGTGKELVARSIHFSGPRRNKPFSPVACSSLAPTLVAPERVLTGAQHSKQGQFEAAGDGTVFLDELGDLPAELQGKLLGSLQEQEGKPAGSSDPACLRARLIAATTRDLEFAIRTGHFRQDLYFRLNIVEIRLPPLRDRRVDIPVLVSAFLEKFCDPARPIRTISEDAMRRIMAYDWPGNIRELEHAMERAVASGSGPILHVEDLPPNLQSPATEKLTVGDELVPLEALERRAIFRALRETAGDKLAAARLLGIGKTTMYRKLKQYESERPQA